MRNKTAAQPSPETDVGWNWRNRYRVWEANRKVFLYPENWIEPELTASANVRASLRKIEAFMREECETSRPRVARKKGVHVLLTGNSPTAALVAAQSLAQPLGLSLYHIDLSSVVSKYIGETEKNLRSVFELAEKENAVLLFDEADALFGKRSEVKDSHDRFANIEMNCLLRGIEEYSGLSILTVAGKAKMDETFSRVFPCRIAISPATRRKG